MALEIAVFLSVLVAIFVAYQIGKATGAKLKPSGEVTVRHVEDPRLRPYSLLVVRMPDSDWSEVSFPRSKTPMSAIRPMSAEPIAPPASLSLSRADYAIAVWPDSRVAVLKWTDKQADDIEPHFYLP